MESFFSLLQKTSSTGVAGRHASSCGWRSWSGSSAPTTAADAKTALDGSPRSNTRHSYAPLTPHDRTYPTESTKLGADPSERKIGSYLLNSCELIGPSISDAGGWVD